MNGQLYQAATPSSGTATIHRTEPESKRLVLALLASCLLHATMIAMPYLGEWSRKYSQAHETTKKLPRALSVSLKPQRQAHPILAPTAAVEQAPAAADHAEPAAPEPMTGPPSPPSPPPTEGIGVLPIPAPTFFTTDQLSKRPQPLDATELDTPETLAIVASGKMILKLWINELGEVVDVEIEKTELPEAFSRSAIAAFKRLPFIPGERNGLHVGSVMRIEVSYVDGRMSSP